ncbi:MULTISPECIES: sugar-transfer associated ATP-grasp domain-containing protein [Helcococcus]|uniref:Sugar-transfer associated ATP-grasp domain-containing protein n=1 Tax=Helcococcus bovis TaxID=3153252 RepID=A0ABW9F6Z5_9FIRM
MIKKIFNADWKSIWLILKDMSKRSGRTKLDLFIDMYKSYKNDGNTWITYYSSNFDRVKDKEIRDSYLTLYKDNSKIYKMFINEDSYKYLTNKDDFVEEYKDFLGRDFINIKKSNMNNFKDFLKKNEIIFAKDPYSCGGKGVERILSNKITNTEKLFNRLLSENKYLIEEGITQHKDMNKLSLNSINTIRTGTVINEKGEVSVIYMVLRVSQTDSYLDNGSLGGYWTLLSEDGVIDKPLYTNVPLESIITKNKLTGFDYTGFQIPMIKELKELAIKAASLHKELRYIGWDIAISEDGPLIIEANEFPGPDLFQTYIHMKDGKGFVKVFEDKMGIKLR